MDLTTMLIIMLIVDILVIVSVIFAVRAAYKIRPVRCAANYLDRESVKYRQQSDTYIRTYVTKIRVKSNK